MKLYLELYADEFAAADALFAEAAAVRAADWQAAEALTDRGEAVYERLEKELDE
jgi:hypothetical protein